MEIFKSIIIGIIQGLTEFLPVSSSGHIEIAKVLANYDPQNDMLFSVVLHAGTALSTIVIFWKDIVDTFKGLFEFKWNESTQFAAKIALSAIPVVIVALAFEKQIEEFFNGNLVLVGVMLLITAGLLFFTSRAKEVEGKEVSFVHSIIIGLAQAVAILPGISRSGSTIATALLLGVDKAKAARFSFLMVLVPILGKTVLDVKDLLTEETAQSTAQISELSVGFIASFVVGLVACKLMIKIVKNGKLSYFAMYCALAGIVALISTALANS